MIRLTSLLLLVPVLALPSPIKLTPLPGTMVVHCDVPLLGNERFSAVLPKVFGDRHHVFLNEPQACSVKWEGPGPSGEWTVSSAPGTSADFRITLAPTEDRVDIRYSVTNHSDVPMEDVWMLTYFAPREAIWVAGDPLSRITMEGPAGPVTLDATDRPKGNRPELAVYPRLSAPPLPYFIRTLQPASSSVSHGDRMTCRRPDGATVSVEATPAAFLFNNRDLASLHVAPSFGTVAPGATVQAQGFWKFSAAPKASPD